MKRRYELISIWSGMIGIGLCFFGMLFGAFFMKMTSEDVSVWFWKPLTVIGAAMLMMIPMIIYSKKSFNLELQEVKNKTEKEVDEWMEKMTKEDKTSYMDSIMSRMNDYEKKWVKIGK